MSMNRHAKYQQSKSNNKKVVDLRVWYATLLKTKKKNEKSIENKSNVYSESNI